MDTFDVVTASLRRFEEVVDIYTGGVSARCLVRIGNRLDASECLRSERAFAHSLKRFYGHPLRLFVAVHAAYAARPSWSGEGLGLASLIEPGKPHHPLSIGLPPWTADETARFRVIPDKLVRAQVAECSTFLQFVEVVELLGYRPPAAPDASSWSVLLSNSELRSLVDMYCAAKEVTREKLCSEVVAWTPGQGWGSLRPLTMFICDFRGASSKDIFRLVFDNYLLDYHASDYFTAMAHPAVTRVVRAAALDRCSKIARPYRMEEPIRLLTHNGRPLNISSIWYAKRIMRVLREGSAPGGMSVVDYISDKEYITTIWRQLERDALARALMPFEMVIKRRACEKLDDPEGGARFVREHGPYVGL